MRCRPPDFSRRMQTFSPAALLLMLHLLHVPVSGQTNGRAVDPLSLPRPSLRATRISSKIHIDGLLDEPAWQRADSTDGTFWQVIPRQGVPSSERTVVKILYDDKNLYIGAILYDPEPDRLVAAGLEQDFETRASDIFGVALDTYHDRQNAFLFAINPAGALFDAQSFNDQAFINRAWEGVVHVKTAILRNAWTVEMAIPFTTLRFHETRDEQTWGINFSRRIRRRSEDSNWAPLPRQFRVYKMSLAGTLTGLSGLKQGRNLWIKPYVSGAMKRTPALSPAAARREMNYGLDLKWGLTPQLTLDLTLFTDFSQVEVDEQQINLTRFSLFFPERRDFFLENEGIFNFSDVRIRNYRTGSGPQNFKLFHSRKIGLSADRRPVPIVAGARLSGRMGDYDIGLLAMQTEAALGLPAENFTVVRLRKNILTNSDIGVMFTNRMATGPDAGGQYNRAFGLDANLRLFRNLIVNSYFAFSDEPGARGADRSTAALQLAWRDPLWDTSVLLKSVGDFFNPGIGFVSRRGVRQVFATLGAHPQPRLPGVFELNPYIDVNVFTNSAGNLESREVRSGLGVRFLNSSVLSFEYSARLEHLFQPTTFAGVEVPTGSYRFALAKISYRSDSGRRLAANLSLATGTFYDGARTSVTGSFVWRPSPHWYFNGSVQRNRLRLAGRTVDADLYGLRFRYGHDTRTFLSGFFQYNRTTDEFISNVRFNFIHAPLSDIFLVFQESRTLGSGLARSMLRDRLLTLKVTKLFAF